MHKLVRAARSRAPERGLLLAVVLALAAGGWFLHEASVFRTSNLDVRVYRDAARTFVGFGDIYAGRFEGLPFTYPPFAAMVFTPLAALTSELALLTMFL